jgi:hypothetical protein
MTAVYQRIDTVKVTRTGGCSIVVCVHVAKLDES